MYKAIMSGAPDWRLFEQATLTISVGMPYHETQKLAAAVDLVNSRFKRCIIDLGDTLQRHNRMAAGSDQFEALEASRRAGDDWLARNAQTLAGLKIPFEILPWDTWLHHAEYAETRAAVDCVYANNADFHAAVEADTFLFINRRGIIDPMERWRVAKHSREFLLEECAGNILLEREYPGVMLYPGTEAASLAMIRRGHLGLPSGSERGRFAHLKLLRAGHDAIAA